MTTYGDITIYVFNYPKQNKKLYLYTVNCNTVCISRYRCDIILSPINLLLKKNVYIFCATEEQIVLISVTRIVYCCSIVLTFILYFTRTSTRPHWCCLPKVLFLQSSSPSSSSHNIIVDYTNTNSYTVSLSLTHTHVNCEANVMIYMQYTHNMHNIKCVLYIIIFIYIYI